MRARTHTRTCARTHTHTHNVNSLGEKTVVKYYFKYTEHPLTISVVRLIENTKLATFIKQKFCRQALS